MLGLETYRRRLTGEVRLIETPQAQIAIHCRTRQYPCGRLSEALWRINAILLQQFERAPSGKVTPLLIGGPQFQRRDYFAVTFHLHGRQYTRLPAINTACHFWLVKVMQQSVNSGW